MILPFKGILYNQDKIDTLANIISPPYDVIHQDLQNTLMNKSPYNFCHLDLPKQENSERYDFAKTLFEKWQNEEILKADGKPAMYLHRHTFHLPNGEKITRQGFFAACQIEEFSKGKILPHEKTLDGPKEDRLNMTRATETNLSPVFSLYADEEKQIESFCDTLVQTTPALDFMSDEGERHELWKIQDETILQNISQTLNDKPFFIADGHHRYETALNYRNEILNQHSDLADRAAPRFLLMYFCNLNDEGLVVLPIHRALHSLENYEWNNFLQTLSETFAIEEFKKSSLSDVEKKQSALRDSHHAFLIVPKNSESGYLISLSHEKWQALAKEKDIHPALAGLDVTVLHQLIFQDILGISEADQASQKNIVYAKSQSKALEEVENGDSDLVFLLNATRIEQMQDVAEAGLKMPQKSTFFYPKIVSGLVLHSVKVDEQDGL